MCARCEVVHTDRIVHSNGILLEYNRNNELYFKRPPQLE